MALIMSLIYWSLSAVLALAAGVIATAVLAALFGFFTTVLVLLAAHSASVLKKHPPPEDQGNATEEILEEFRRQRAERLKDYEP